MLKRVDLIYVLGRPKGPCINWKRDPFNVDAVMMYAQRGHGKRSSFYSDYTFGVWRNGENGEELVPIGKAYSGITDEELGQLDRYVRNHTINRYGPVREVEYSRDKGLILEIAFEGINWSSRHKIRHRAALSAHQPDSLGQAGERRGSDRGFGGIVEGEGVRLNRAP